MLCTALARPVKSEALKSAQPRVTSGDNFRLNSASTFRPSGAMQVNNHCLCASLSWILRNSSGVSKGIDKPVVQSGRDFPYIRVGGGQ